MSPPDLQRTTLLLKRARQGDAVSAAELLPLVYEELHRLASAYMRRQRSGHTLQPTALVHEAYLKLVQGSEVDWQDRSHFIGVAARAMRQVLIQHARQAKARKRGGGQARVTLGDLAGPSASNDIELEALGEVLEALERLDERKARVVELRFFGGLTNEEVAEALRVSLRTVEGDWYLARAWLRGALSKD